MNFLRKIVKYLTQKQYYQAVENNLKLYYNSEYEVVFY